jgi:hypothetical protein
LYDAGPVKKPCGRQLGFRAGALAGFCASAEAAATQRRESDRVSVFIGVCPAIVASKR